MSFGLEKKRLTGNFSIRQYGAEEQREYQYSVSRYELVEYVLF